MSPEERPPLSLVLRSEGGPDVRKAYGPDQTVEVSIQGGVVTVSVKGGAGIHAGQSSPSEPRDMHPEVVDELSRERARRALASIGYLLTRREAAAYTRRSVQTFDRFLRPQLRNAGTPARPLFLKEDIDQCLQSLPSPGSCESTPAASTTASGSPTRGFVTRSRRGQANLKKLRSVPLDSTRK